MVELEDDLADGLISWLRKRIDEKGTNPISAMRSKDWEMEELSGDGPSTKNC